MAQTAYRGNLSAAIYPMTLARSGRSVIIAGPDQNFNRSIDSPDDSNRDVGIPQAIYLENVLPTADGYQSVGYKLEPDLLPEIDMFIIEIKIPGRNTPEVIAFSSTTNLAWRKTPLGPWAIVPIAAAGPGPTSENDISWAIVRGTVYIFYQQNLYTYDAAAPAMANITGTVTPGGILSTAIGIAGSYNYLLLLEQSGLIVSVAWSSTTTPTDFTPSLVTGASSEAVANVQGRAKFLRASPEGFYLYTSNNVIQASYTGNRLYPWRFIPVKDSIGVINTWEVYSDIDESAQIAVSRSNSIVAIQGASSDNVAQEITEYLERNNTFDDFDYSLNLFEVKAIPAEQETFRVYVFNSRYIFISMKELVPSIFGLYDAVFVFDLALKRYGKLRIRHSHLVSLPDAFTNKLKLGVIDNFMQTTRLWYLDINEGDSGGYDVEPMKGVMLLGKFQYVRSRDICLDEISVESGQPTDLAPEGAPYPSFSLHVMPTLDGKTFTGAIPQFLVTSLSTGTVLNYLSSAEGRNVSLLIKGAFDLCSFEMRFHLGGKN